MYKYVLLYYMWTLSFASDVISQSPLQPHVYLRISTIYVFITVGGCVCWGPHYFARGCIMLLTWGRYGPGIFDYIIRSRCLFNSKKM